MSFLNNLKTKRNPQKHSRTKSEITTPQKPLSRKSSITKKAIKSKPKEQEDYCDLSIIITNEEIYPEYSNHHLGDDIIQSAKQSLIELQLEAKNYVISSKRFNNKATQQLKSSLVIADHHSHSGSAQDPHEMLKSLSQSILELNKRLLVNEEALQVHVEENTTLKFEVKDLEEKMKAQHCKLETNPIQIGCTCSVM